MLSESVDVEVFGEPGGQLEVLVGKLHWGSEVEDLIGQFKSACDDIFLTYSCRSIEDSFSIAGPIK